MIILEKQARGFDWKKLPLSICSKGNAYDAYFTLKLFKELVKKIDEVGIKLLKDLMNPVILTSNKAELRGMDVDVEVKDQIKIELEKDIEKIKNKLLENVRVKKIKENFNLNSNDQMCELFFSSEEGFQLFPPILTSKENPSVSVDCVEILEEMIKKEIKKKKRNK